MTTIGETWRCVSCGNSVAPMGMCQTCGIFGLRYENAHVPTPEELDELLSDISAAGYASEAREIVENWTRKWWGVESAFTTKWDAERYFGA